jgi:hypothetical protein
MSLHIQLGSDGACTRSIHIPAAHAYAPPRHHHISSSPPVPAMTSPTNAPLHWQSAISAPAATSALTASLRAQRLQQNGGDTAPLQIYPADNSPSSSLSVPSMYRAQSVPSSSASTVTCTSFSGYDSSAIQSPSHSATGPDSPLRSLQESTPCPVSLWWGCEEAEHARSVLSNYARTLQIYTQPLPGSRRPAEFIGRVKRDRLDVSRLLRHADQFKQKQRAFSQQESCNRSTSPCLSSSFSPSSNGLCGPLSALDNLPLPGSFATLDCISIYSRDTLPLGVSFPLIRHEWVCTSWHREDGVALSIRTIHTEYNDVEEEQLHSSTDPADCGREEDPDETLSKATLRVFAKSLSKKIPRHSSSTKGSPTRSPSSIRPLRTTSLPYAVTNTAIAANGHIPFSLNNQTSSNAINHTNSNNNWHPAAPQTTLQRAASTSSAGSKASSHHPLSSPTSQLPTSFLYSLPIYSEDCKDGCYSTFGTCVQRDTADVLARRGVAAVRAGVISLPPVQPASQAGAVATVAEQSLGYAGSQNECIYTCMKTLGRKIAGGSQQQQLQHGIGNGGDDTKGEANATVDVDLEMRAMTAALERMHQESEAAAAAVAAANAVSSTTATTESDDSEEAELEEQSSEADSEEDSSSADDNLEDIGEDPHPHQSPVNHHLSNSATGFSFAADDEEQEDDDEGSDNSDNNSSSSDSLSDISSSDNSDVDSSIMQQRTTSGSVAIAMSAKGKSVGADKKRNQKKKSASARADAGDDGMDSFSSSPSSNSFARSFGVGSSSLGASIGAGSLGEELAAQLHALNGGVTAKKKTNGKKGGIKKSRK